MTKYLLFILLSATCILAAQNPSNPYKAPLYWNPYEYNIIDENVGHLGYIPESEWEANINWMQQNLLPSGYNMICIDGWGDDQSYNEFGYRKTHSSKWTHDYAWWSAELQKKGMTLGIYNNPLWINRGAASAGVKVKGTNIALSSLIDNSENALWFSWVQVDRPGAEEFVKGYVKYYADMGVRYLRVDFLSWFEDGYDKNMGTVGVNRPVQEYETALRWMREACDANGVFLSLVMPHLKNEAATELKYGHMIRINEDAGLDAGWYRFSDMDRGVRHSAWSQYYNAFDGYIYWSSISGRNQMILDGDFIRLNTFANDEEKKSVISLHLIAGGPVSVSDRYNSIGNDLWLYQNNELLALNKDGFVGKPLSNDPTNVNSQIWTGQKSNGDWIVALFNRESTTQARYFEYSKLGLNLPMVRDLWEHTEQGNHAAAYYQIPAHGCKVLLVKAQHQSVMNCAGTFNNWNLTSLPMTLEGDNWVAEYAFLAGAYQLKFANTNDWTGNDWGNNSGLSGQVTLSTGGLPNLTFNIPINCTYRILFNDITLNYSIYDKVVTAIETPEPASARLFISPNPTNDIVTISGVKSTIQKIELVDLQGCLISAYDTGLSTINLSNCRAGIYMLKITTDTEIITKKIVKY